MRSLPFAALLLASLVSSSVVFAAAPKKPKPAPALAKAKAKAKKSSTLVASAAPLPPLPPPAAPVPVATKDAAPGGPKPSADARSGPVGSAGRGFVLTLSSGLSYVGGQIAQDLTLAGALMTFDVRVGAYVTPHVGIFSGVHGGYGGLFEGCAGPCSAHHYQVPVVAQYAVVDRTRGLYVEGGLALLSTLGASSAEGEAPEAFTVSTPMDVKIGIGYRINGAELRLGADLGRFENVKYVSSIAKVEGEVAADRRELHVGVGLSVGYQFMP